MFPERNSMLLQRMEEMLLKVNVLVVGLPKFRFVSNRQGAGLASATKDLRNKASNYLMSENTRNKIKSYGHRNLDKAVDSATIGLANKLSTGSGRKRKGKGLLLGKNSPFNKIPLIGAIL